MTHPDPQWWKRAEITKSTTRFDLCDNCGHTRDMHTGMGQCNAPSTSLVDKHPCICLSGKQFRKAEVVFT